MTVRLAYHDARVLASASKSRGRRVHRDLAAIAAENSNCQRLSAKFDILHQEVLDRRRSQQSSLAATNKNHPKSGRLHLKVE